MDVSTFWLIRGLIGVVVGILAVAWPGITTSGEWLLALSGVMSVLFGILVFAFPDAGTVGIAWVLGIYAAAAGVVLIVLGLRLRSPALVYSS